MKSLKTTSLTLMLLVFLVLLFCVSDCMSLFTQKQKQMGGSDNIIMKHTEVAYLIFFERVQIIYLYDVLPLLPDLVAWFQAMEVMTRMFLEVACEITRICYYKYYSQFLDAWLHLSSPIFFLKKMCSPLAKNFSHLSQLIPYLKVCFRTSFTYRNMNHKTWLQEK